MFGYFWRDRTIKTIYPNEINSFASLINLQKGKDMRRISFISPDIIGQGVFYSPLLKPTTVLGIQPSEKIDFLEARLAYSLVPRYYHDRHDASFMKNINYQGKIFSYRSNHINKRLYELDRVLYIYVCTTVRTTVLTESEINWDFPDKYSKTLGLLLGLKHLG